MHKDRILIMVISTVTSLVVIGIMSLVLNKGFFADFLLDRNSSFGVYPFTIQNIMWLVFFLGLGELYLRFKDSAEEQSQIEKRLLPEDASIMLRSNELGEIYKSIQQSSVQKQYFLQRLIGRCVLQFQTSRSIDQANGLFNSSMELYQHEIELNYNILRYIVWLIPTLGFIGTVVGIALALNFAGSGQIEFQDPQLLSVLTAKLGVAFNTTLLALLQSAILMFLLHIAQGREEWVLNQIGQYCLDNLINRLYEK